MIGLRLADRPLCSIKGRCSWVPMPQAVRVDPNKPRETMKEYRARLLAPKLSPQAETHKP